MAITIDPLTFVINVPKADLTLIQSNPTEIRQLDLNWFRLQLKALEADFAQGIYLYKTHSHNTEVTLSGINYARIVEILDPYTITFEDGQYAVNFVGANTNVQDKTNVNQVSIRPSNSAGLISSADIEYSSFNNYILIDELQGVLGTTFPAGTIRAPVRLTSDAKIIADFRGLNSLRFIGNGTLGTGDTFEEFIISGQNAVISTISIDPAAVVTDSEFRECTITGTLDGGSVLRNCVVSGLNYVNGVIFQSRLDPGTITLGGGAVGHFMDCYSGVPGTGTPTIDMGGSGNALAMRNYNGGIKIINKTGADNVSIDLNSGQVRLDPATVTAGTIVVRGVGKLVDDTTGLKIPSGTWNGGVTILNETINGADVSVSLDPQEIADAVWDEPTVNHTTTGTTGKALQDAGGAANPWSVPLDGNNTEGTFGYLMQNTFVGYFVEILTKFTSTVYNTIKRTGGSQSNQN